MHLPVSIPEPCHESWDDMQARSNGRHCNACCKTVVDFTNWEAEDILSYLKSNQQTCGRFRADQLQPQQDVVAAKNFSWWQAIGNSALSHIAKVAAAVVLFFHLAACNAPVQTEGNEPVNTMSSGIAIVSDTSKDDGIMGGIEAVFDTPAIAPKKPIINKPVPMPPEQTIVGEPAIIEDTVIITNPEPAPQIMGAPIMIRPPQQDSLSNE